MNFDNIKRVRESIPMNQTDFWNRVGVTQSGGSRYESGRTIPKPVKMLLTIAYGTTSERSKALYSITKG